MAFNPFHAFRKHQKVVFAGLTILCMITFILTGSSLTGRGDFFDWVQTTLGGEGRYPQVASVYGKKIDQRDVGTLREQRMIASDYMQVASQIARGNLATELQKVSEKLGGLKGELDTILQF